MIAENYLPKGIRHLISAESGLNDGLAYPFVLLCILMLERSGSDGDLLSHWFVDVVLWEVGGAIFWDGLFGYLAGRLLKWDKRQKTIDLLNRSKIFQKHYLSVGLSRLVWLRFFMRVTALQRVGVIDREILTSRLLKSIFTQLL